MREIFKMESDELYKNYIDFHMEGYERFNTQLVRNTIFLSNIQRILRSKINDVFVKAHKIVELSHKISDYSITEYNLVDKGTYSNPNTWSNI
jgi:adenine C2-methylase RlmN of 23S rRNA A2503 and tRNA A37